MGCWAVVGVHIWDLSRKMFPRYSSLKPTSPTILQNHLVLTTFFVHSWGCGSAQIIPQLIQVTQHLSQLVRGTYGPFGKAVLKKLLTSEFGCQEWHMAKLMSQKGIKVCMEGFQAQ